MQILQSPIATIFAFARTLFTLLAFVAVYYMLVAWREQGPATASSLGVASTTLFDHLQACGVPGVRERILGRGLHTVAFAGEFQPTAKVHWTTGSRRIYLYILSGHGVVRIGGSIASARGGDFFVIPQGLRHAVSATDGPIRAIYVEDKT
jgi:quercetin dioxygenase-like cupin family protein